MRISDWSSDVCSSDVLGRVAERHQHRRTHRNLVRAQIFDHAFVVMRADRDPDLDIMRAVAEVRGELLVHRVIGRGIFIPADAERSRFARTARTRFAVAFAFTRRRGALFLRLGHQRSEEHTSELQSLMRISYAVFCLKKKTPLPSLEHHTYTH